MMRGNLNTIEKPELQECGHECVKGKFVVTSGGATQDCNSKKRANRNICPYPMK